MWQELELEPESEPEPKLWIKVEPDINNFDSATLGKSFGIYYKISAFGY